MKILKIYQKAKSIENIEELKKYLSTLSKEDIQLIRQMAEEETYFKQQQQEQTKKEFQRKLEFENRKKAMLIGEDMPEFLCKVIEFDKKGNVHKSIEYI